MYQFDKLIGELSEQSGLSIELDEHYSCSFEYGNLIITLQFSPYDNGIVLFVALTNPDELSVVDKKLMRRALSLTHKGKGTEGNFLGLFQNNLILTKKINSTNITADELADYIFKFSEQAVKVKDRLLNECHS